LALWLDEVSKPEWIWYVKYLAANDTVATGAHQAGPLIGNQLFRNAFPALLAKAKESGTAEASIPVILDSHSVDRVVRVVWYRSKGEGRLTRWGGAYFPLLDADSTGALVAFAFHVPSFGMNADGCRVWLSRSPEEEDEIVEWTGPVEPGRGILHSPFRQIEKQPDESTDRPCSITARDAPYDWLVDFPSGVDIIAETVRRLPSARRDPPDSRLLRRRDCEYELFRSLEKLLVLPRIKEGFGTVDLFVDYANTLTNRRKSRSGKSLEIHAKLIFDEEGLSHSWAQKTEGNRVPDFIFPSIERYRESAWSDRKLRMLAAKTTCKDRWRQVLNEARRIRTKHLLTLQQGVSATQFNEMKEENVVLVVPRALQRSYPKTVQPHLLTLETFIGETRRACT
jgi:restriction endonuclease EcoRII-like protein